jgi:hypothetical protein
MAFKTFQLVIEADYTTDSNIAYSLDIYDDEVRRVCKTPGDPCGCTRQFYQRSDLPLPSPWIKY